MSASHPFDTLRGRNGKTEFIVDEKGHLLPGEQCEQLLRAWMETEHPSCAKKHQSWDKHRFQFWVLIACQHQHQHAALVWSAPLHLRHFHMVAPKPLPSAVPRCQAPRSCPAAASTCSPKSVSGCSEGGDGALRRNSGTRAVRVISCKHQYLAIIIASLGDGFHQHRRVAQGSHGVGRQRGVRGLKVWQRKATMGESGLSCCLLVVPCATALPYRRPLCSPWMCR